MRSFSDYKNLTEREMRPIELYLCYMTADYERFSALLDENIQLKGYGYNSYYFSEFADEYSPDDEEYFGDSGVKISLFPPAVHAEMTEILTQDEYYNYLEDCANCYLQSAPINIRQHIYSKLAKVKDAFRHAK